MPPDPLDVIRERMAPLGDPVELIERDYEACGFHREVACPAEAIEDIATAFRDADYFLEMMAATDCEGSASVSYTFNRWGAPDRTLVRVTVAYDESVPSIWTIFPGAEWNEREAFELVGVQFSGHPGLKRLLLPEDADFFPLRKDYGIPKAIVEAREKFQKKKALAAARKAKAAKAAAAKREAPAKKAAPAAKTEATETPGPKAAEKPAEAAAPKAAEKPAEAAAPKAAEKPADAAGEGKE